MGPSRAFLKRWLIRSSVGWLAGKYTIFLDIYLMLQRFIGIYTRTLREAVEEIDQEVSRGSIALLQWMQRQ